MKRDAVRLDREVGREVVLAGADRKPSRDP
jgi:hypothetical protein